MRIRALTRVTRVAAYCLTLAITMLALAATAAAQQDLQAELRALAAQGKDTTVVKLRGPLKAVVPGRLAAAGLVADPTRDLVSRDGLYAVSIRTRGSEDVPTVLRSLRQPAVNILGNAIEAFVSPDELAMLNDHTAVLTVETIRRPEPRAISQGRLVHNAQNWISGGFGGAGVKVGIIDVGFLGLQSLMGTELPAAVTGRCYFDVGTWSPSLSACDTVTDHGTAVSESLMDVAPGAQLFVANPISPVDFVNTVNWMVSQGVAAINYSVAQLWDGPGDGTSSFADSPLNGVNAAVAGGAVFVAAAGNEARKSWLGPWRDEDDDRAPEFGLTSGTELNGVTLAAGQRILVQLRWEDSWAAASRDIDIGLGHSALGLVASSVESQRGFVGDTPFEAFTYQAPMAGVYYLFLDHFAGGTPSWFQVQVFNSSGPELEYHTISGSIGNPAESANPGLLAVGAAAWNTQTVIESFSSQGPTPDGRSKPDIVGPIAPIPSHMVLVGFSARVKLLRTCLDLRRS